MKIVLIVISLIFAGVVGFLILGLMSQSGKANGLQDGKLTKCPDKPNCVCSEFTGATDHYTDPVSFSRDRTAGTLLHLKTSIEEMGGHIQVEKEHYLAATFRSRIFRFVDDLEVRLDIDEEQIHFRSASRVGHGDLGVNKKRIKQLKALYATKLQ